jgi:hypothetical protein
MKRVGWFVLAFGALCLVASASYAADNTNGKWALHFAGKHNPATNDCTFQLAACEHLVVEGPADPGDYDVYVIAADVDAINWSRFAISCDGPIHIIDWQPCCDSETPTAGWPGCDEGIGLKWLTDQPGPYVTMGILTVHISGPSVLSVAPHPGDGSAEWCASSGPCPETNDPAFFGSVGFGRPGYNPCAPGPSGGIEAIVRFDPRTLNLKSEGSYVGCTVELPDGYDTRDIDEMTVMLNGIVPAMPGNPDGGGNKRDFKFDRAQVQALFCSAFDGTSSSALMGGGPPIGHGAQFALHVAGDLYDGTHWAGRDTSRVIHQDECEGYECHVSPTSLDFGSVDKGDTADRTFTITNTGTKPLVGRTGESCPDFEIVAGGGPYMLGPGDTRDVTVRFAPTSCGSKKCVIDAGGCGEVVCTGEGGPMVACEVTPLFLDYATTPIYAFWEQQFVIRNTGCAPFSGDVEESCDDFDILEGGGPYTLGPGEGRIVKVRFQPLSCGPKTCYVQTGAPVCSNVFCQGEGTGSGCKASVTSLDIGTVSLGDSDTEPFTITNVGCIEISGTITKSGVDCSEFSIVSGGSYTLAPGAVHTVTVEFAPTSCGVKTCRLDLGGCGFVDLSGTGGGWTCGVSPQILEFGTVPVGSYVDKTSTITNTGCNVLEGTPSEICPDYSIVAGGVPFSLDPGQSHTLTIRFQPTSPGTKYCWVPIGPSACQSVECRGDGGFPQCQVAPATLTFGPLAVGSYDDELVTITNTGGTPLSGDVALAPGGDPGFTIMSGAGPYTLNPSQTLSVVVRYVAADCDSAAVTIMTGCQDVPCLGTATGPGCHVDPLALDFGSVGAGSISDQQFTITNTGCTVLGGVLSEACTGFELVGDMSYSLLPGQSKTFTVRFAPLGIGPYDCYISTGPICGDAVYCEGTAELAGTSLQVLTSASTAAVTIRYSLLEAGSVTLQIYDAAGRLVRTLDNGYQGAGAHKVEWDRKTDGGRHVNAGVYFVKLSRQGETQIEKALILR